MDIISLSKANNIMKDAAKYHKEFLGEGVEAHFSSLDERLDWLEGQYGSASATAIYQLIVKDAKFTNTEIRDGKLQLVYEDLAHPTSKKNYAKSGTYEKTFDFTTGFIATLTMIALKTASALQIVKMEIATSTDGLLFNSFTVIDTTNPPSARFMKVKITLTSNDQLTITYDTNVILEVRDTIQNQELIRSKSTNMTLDTTWTEEGSLHRKLIARDDWLRTDKMNVLSKEVKYTENLIPTMTSYTAPSGKVEYGNSSYLVWSGIHYEPYHLFGDSVSGAFSSASTTPIWVSYEFEEAKKIKKYKMTTHAWIARRSPSSWNFEAWDGASWVILDTKSNQPYWGEGESREFIINNDKHYQKYRIFLFSNFSEPQIHLARLEMMEEVVGKTLILHEGEYKKWEEGSRQTGGEGIPIMTSNTSPSGVVTASDEYGSGYEGWYAMNGKSFPDGSYWSTTNKLGWIEYEFPSEVVVSGYYFKTLNDYPNRSPKNWTFECYDYSSSSWLVADSNSLILATDTKQEFVLQENIKGKKFRLNITENFGDNELSLDLFQIILSEINQPSAWKGYDLYKIETDGMDSLSPLLDRRIETLEPLPMEDKSEILQAGEVGKVFSKTINLKKYLDIRSIKVEVEK